MTFDTYIAEVIEKSKHLELAGSTLVRLESVARTHLVPTFGKLRVVEITSARIERFLLGLLCEGKLKRSSVSQIAKTLSGIFAQAVPAFGLPRNPAHGVWTRLNPSKKKKKADALKPVKALNADEARRFLAAAREAAPGWHPLFAALFLAGLRPGEALALTADRVDFGQGTIPIDRQLSQHDGESSTKTGSSRVVDLAPALAPILRTAFEPRPTTAKVVSITGKQENENFTASTKPWPLAPGVSAEAKPAEVAHAYKLVLRAWKRTLKDAHIERPNTATVGRADSFALHSGRHTFCSLLIAAGVSPAYVQRQAGHESIEITTKVYGSAFSPTGSLDALAAIAGSDGMVTNAQNVAQGQDRAAR